MKTSDIRKLWVTAKKLDWVVIRDQNETVELDADDRTYLETVIDGLEKLAELVLNIRGKSLDDKE